jgi:phosphatidate cytidylyltransferase
MLLFFVTIVLCSDLLQWAWSRMYSQHLVAEQVDASRSWEGVIGGALCTAVLGTLLAWAAPFPRWWQTGAMSVLIALMAAAGALTMSAIKRDRGELGGGAFIDGPGGVLSRIDSICFAAPVFYHVSRYFFGA